MSGKSNYMKKVIFRLRWMFMSPRKQYAYLWNRTRNSWGNFTA